MAEATAESLAACEGRAGMTIQSDLAARFLDTMTAKLEKGRKAGADGVRIELADLDLLIKMAEPSAEAVDHVVSRMLEVIDSLVVFGVDLASGPDSTVVTKVEIVDGGAILRHEIEDLGAVVRSDT
jgi:predicted DNA-binding protein (UPF0278 family)